MCYFFINIPKIALNVGRSVIRLQRLLYFCAEILLYYSAIFIGEGARFGFVPYPRYATNTPTTVFFFESCAII